MSKKVDLTRRKVLGGLASIGAASAAAGAGTMALFSDQETSSGNGVQAGTLNLADVSDGTWKVIVSPGLAPGGTVSGTVSLQNDGSLPGDHIEATASSIVESDAPEPSDSDIDGAVGSTEFAKHLFIDEIVYPNGDDDFFTSMTQVPGAFVYDVNRDGTKNADIVPANDPAGGGRTGVVHATSNKQETKDYARSIVDVSSQGLTLNNVSTLEYDWYEGASNTVHTPDEVKLLLENDTGHHFVYQHLTDDSDNQEQTWQTRDVAAEIDGTNTSGNDWFEIDLNDGSTKDLGDSLLDDYGSATLKQVGFGAGNFSTSNTRVIDVYYDNLVVNSTSYEFRSRNASLDDLNSVTIDNVRGIKSGGKNDFHMTLRLDPMVGNDFQSDGVAAEFTFTLNQQANQ